MYNIPILDKYTHQLLHAPSISSFCGNDSLCFNKNKNFANYDNFKEVVTVRPNLYQSTGDLVLNTVSTCNFQNIINKCNSNCVTHIKFKQLCYALEDSVLHNLIKYYIVNTYKNSSPSIEQLYKITLNHIYNNELTDVTIKLSNGESFKCNKLVLNTNEYFKKMINDCGNNINEIILITEPDITILSIKLLYHKSYDEIQSTNFYKIFMLMDMMLMSEEHVVMMLNVLENNMKSIIYYEIEQNNYDNILKLTEQLKYISKNSSYLNKTNYFAFEIYESIFKLDFGIKIFNFTEWSTLFNDEQKLNAIKLTKNLELLNDSKISFHAGLEFLKEFDFSNNIYTKIDNLVSLDNTDIYFNVKVCKNYFRNITNIIILNQWYPVFDLYIFERIDVKIINLKSSSITIKILNKDLNNLHNGSRILFGSDNISTNLENSFIVERIKKCQCAMSAIVNSTIFTSDDSITYKIKLNTLLHGDYEKLIWNEKNVKNGGATNFPIWRVKQISHKVEGKLI